VARIGAGRALPTVLALAVGSSALTPVLQLHVVGTRALSTQLSNNQSLPTLLPNTSLTVGLINNGVRITGPRNFATVSTANVIAKNGVIHVIDTVLLP
jgi:uncharacterized surface protein with fasciclin (FAS1) repeats